MRGEHSFSAFVAARAAGSSPRARGTLSSSIRRKVDTRIIPACAGNTPRRRAHKATRPDHPRVRGEHIVKGSTPTLKDGSSPRARGTRRARRTSRRGQWIIPACAGNTDWTGCRYERMPDHPRVRGEHSCVSSSIASMAGSSPRARGTRSISSDCYANTRIIPACAGNTTPRLPRCPRRSDHPRVRGEHQ